MKKRPKRKTGGNSHLLEHTVNTLAVAGFEIFEPAAWRRMKGASPLPERYVFRNFPVLNPFGPGFREGLIVAPACTHFASGPDGTARIIFEAKWQDGSGSADEKLAYVWISFMESDIPNWILVMDGKRWATDRGRRILAWLRTQPIPAGRTWRVLSSNEFVLFVRKVWGISR